MNLLPFLQSTLVFLRPLPPTLSTAARFSPPPALHHRSANNPWPRPRPSNRYVPLPLDQSVPSASAPRPLPSCRACGGHRPPEGNEAGETGQAPPPLPALPSHWPVRRAGGGDQTGGKDQPGSRAVRLSSEEGGARPAGPVRSAEIELWLSTRVPP